MPMLRVTFTSDAFWIPAPSLVIDGDNWGPAASFRRLEGDVWIARFETDLPPGSHNLQLIDEPHHEAAAYLTMTLPAWESISDPFDPTLRERVADLWRWLFK